MNSAPDTEAIGQLAMQYEHASGGEPGELYARLLRWSERHENQLPHPSLVLHVARIVRVDTWLSEGPRGYSRRRERIAFRAAQGIEEVQPIAIHTIIVGRNTDGQNNAFKTLPEGLVVRDPRAAIDACLDTEQALAELDEDDRELILKRAEGRLLSELASEYGVTRQAVDQRVLRIFGRLKAKILRKGSSTF